MLNVHLSYKSLSSWRTPFRYGGRPKQFSRLKEFAALLVPGGGYPKETIIQVILIHTGVLLNGQSCLRRKGDITGASVHSTTQRNSTYVHTVNSSIYDTRCPKNHHSQIYRYK